MRAGAMALLLLLASGCGHVRHIDAFPDPFPRVELPEAQRAPDRPGDCPGAVAVHVGAWADTGAPCGGVLVPTAKLGRLVEGYELYGQAQDAYAVMVGGRQVDRVESQRIIDATEGLTSEARTAQGRWFVVGVGVGGTTLGLLVGALVGLLGR